MGHVRGTINTKIATFDRVLIPWNEPNATDESNGNDMMTQWGWKEFGTGASAVILLIAIAFTSAVVWKIVRRHCQCTWQLHQLATSATDTPSKSVRIVIMGDPRVGKTAILKRFLNMGFDPEYSPTVTTDHRAMNIKIRNEDVRVRFWDISGELFNSPGLFQTYIFCTDIVLLVFDVTDRASFNRITAWYDLVTKYRCNSKSVILVFVGNKSDKTGEDRCVTTEEAKELAEHRVRLNYSEVSALSGIGVKSLLYTTITKVITDQKSSRRATGRATRIEATGEGTSTMA